MLFHWLPKGNSLKYSSTYGIRTSQVGAGSGSEDCIMVRGGRAAAATAVMMGATSQWRRWKYQKALMHRTRTGIEI